MEDQVQVEAAQYIPYPIEEVSLDFEVLGPVKDNPEMVRYCWPHRAPRTSKCASPHWNWAD